MKKCHSILSLCVWLMLSILVVFHMVSSPFFGCEMFYICQKLIFRNKHLAANSTTESSTFAPVNLTLYPKPYIFYGVQPSNPYQIVNEFSMFEKQTEHNINVFGSHSICHIRCTAQNK